MSSGLNCKLTGRRIAQATVLGCLLALSLSSSALAARNMQTGIADFIFQSAVTPDRDFGFQTTVKEGADIVRIDVLWRRVVGDSKPLTPRDPADASYDFSAVDGAVQAASAHGLDVLLTVYSAPDWAEGPGRPPVEDAIQPGTWKPDPGDLADFATALATRYSGSYTP